LISTTLGREEYISDLIAARATGWTLQREFYTDAEILNVDLERVFRPAWLYAGHSSRIPRSGDYFLYEVAGESIIIVRAQDGAVHALRNTCRHRGSRVCTSSSGNAAKLVCPYHQWVYGLDGTLLKARLMPEDFDRSGFGLRQVSVQTLCGLIFICLHEEHAPEFARFVSRIQPQLRPQNLHTARVAQKREYVVEANWKLVLENSRECYHCGTGHPQYCRAVGFAAGIDSSRVAEEDLLLTEARVAELVARGIEAKPVDFSEAGWFHARRFFLRGGFVSESLDGASVAPQLADFPGSELGVLAVVTYPNLLLEACADYAMAMRFTPLSATRTQISLEWLVADQAVEDKHYQIGRLEEFWKLTAEQDWRLCEENQMGVNTNGYMPGLYAPEERGVEQFIEWYLEQLRSCVVEPR
jgi:Rieske 2Fe-2S family protein